MSMSGQPRSQGRIEGALTRLFMRTATVGELRVLDDAFRLVTLRGEALRGVRWEPGQKVQVAMGGWAYRTYTPITWDASAGATELLVFLHGDAPGSAWGRALAIGDACTLFGPRDSLDLGALDRPGLLFGDETSVGLARSLRSTARGADGVRVVLEVTSKDATAKVVDALEIPNVDLVQREPEDAHLATLEELVLDHVKSRSITSCALTGKAPSIQRLNKRLRAAGLGSRQIRTRAYWAPGKVGLD